MEPPEIAQDVFKRDQYHAGIYGDQHVSEAVGSDGSCVS